MKRTKKQLSLFLVLVMALTVLNGFAAKANTNITVTLRVEQDEKTLITPVEVTLTEADKKSYGIGLSTDTLTPLHALAKYLSETKGASDEAMKNYIQASRSQYGLFLEGINTDGSSSGSPAAGSQDDVSWMFAVNNTDPNVSVSAYELKDHDSIVLYGIWGGGTWPDLEETNYSYWDQDSYSAVTGKPLTVRLKGLGYDESYNSIIKDIAGASVIAAPYSEREVSVTESTASITGTTDENGTASLTFAEAGAYTLSAYRKAKDGTHYDISRPYAVVTVSDEHGKGAANVVSAVTPVDTARGGTIWTHSFATGNGTSCNSIPILTETAIYIVNADTLYELSYEDGRVLRKLTLCAKMNSICNMLLEDKKLYIPLSGSKMECVDTVSMTSCWRTDGFGGQSLSTLFYHEGYLYAGSTTVHSQGTSGIFYCLDASDGSTQWTYEDPEHEGGYYWSGGIVHENILYFAGDNGILVAHSLTEDEVYDHYTLTSTAKIRAGITYSGETDALYTVSNDGILHEIKTAGNTIQSVHSFSIMEEAGFISCTSTPTIYNNRIYVGCMADQYGYVAVLDAAKRQPVYHVQGPYMAEVKSSPLVSTRGNSSGKVYVYFSANAKPGGVYYFADDPSARSSICQTLFTPATASQYCLASITSGTDGTLYYSNDSGTLFAVREVDHSSDIPLPITQIKPTASEPTSIPKSTPAAVSTPAPTTSTPVSKKQAKPAKPASIKVKKKKGKLVLRWKNATKGSQTLVFYRYGSGKWKKKIIKKKTTISINMKKKKTLHIRLRSRKKFHGSFVYSGYTKTFHFKY